MAQSALCTGCIAGVAGLLYIQFFFLDFALLVQTGFGLDPFVVGSIFAPCRVGFVLASLTAPRLVARWGTRAIFGGALIYAISIGLLIVQVQKAGLELVPVRLIPQWMLAHRQKVPDGSGTARALDYSLKRWTALTRYLDDGMVPIDNNWVENQIRPWALGRSNWLFAGSLRSGQRAAAVMTLIQSAKLNGHDPYAYLKDVLTKLPTQKNNAIDELLPHNWKPVSISKV